jgi:hypothetical protein
MNSTDDYKICIKRLIPRMFCYQNCAQSLLVPCNDTEFLKCQNRTSNDINKMQGNFKSKF